MATVYANCDTICYEGRLRVELHIDDVWDGDDPFVRTRPDLFSATPLRIHRTVPIAPVEQATAAPGEKRTTRRAG